MIPDVEIAPLGAGIQIEPKSICEELADFIATRLKQRVSLRISMDFEGSTCISQRFYWSWHRMTKGWSFELRLAHFGRL